jgi:DNA-binding NtrC family response regulator
MALNSGCILVVDDNEDLLLAARLFLKQHFALVHTERDPEKIPLLMRNETYDVILLDMNFTVDATSGSEGFHWLEHILQLDPSAVVIMITAYGDVETAVRAVKAGATDFVLKPWRPSRLRSICDARAWKSTDCAPGRSR